MEQHLSFYTAQYQPSFDADQSKLDEFSLESLNTPDINPDFFTSDNLFPKVGANSLMGSTSSNVSLGKMAIKSDDDYMVFSDLGLNQSVSMASAAASAFDRTTYSPYSEDNKQLQQQQMSHQQQHHHQLDSASININSPEMMMPVSPNKVCPQLDGYDLLDAQQQQFSQMTDYESMVTFDYHHHSSPSTSNSRSSSISAGSDTYLSEYILSDPAAHLMTGSVDPSLCRVPHSPAASISSYSSDSSTSNKKYIQLETVQHQPQIVIKQEPVDSLYPTVVEDLYQSMPVQQLQQQQQAPVSSYSTINTSDLHNYYYTTNALPSTVSSAIQMQQQTVAVPTVTPTTNTNTSSNNGGNRKRNAATAFASTSASASTSHNHQSTSGSSSTTSSPGSSKKPRMTKREKQKLMEGDISKYETENRELHNSINLLERQIQFCKRFLSENVAPVIQRQQMQSHSHFGPNQSQLVAIALESQ